MVLYSQEPMALKSLNMALAITPGDKDIHPAKLQTDIEAVLKQVLGILIDCRQTKKDSCYPDKLSAILVHQSLKDSLVCLTEPSQSESIPPELHILCVSMNSRHVHEEFLRAYCTLMCSPVGIMQLHNCHDSTDRLWQGISQWVRKLQGMQLKEQLHEKQEEEQRVEQQKLEIMCFLERVPGWDQWLVEQFMNDGRVELLLALVFPSTLGWLLSNGAEQLHELDGLDMLHELCNSWMDLQAMLAV
jgi:hypothetical protein